MPILVKHSGNIAPTLVGSYGGGMGRRIAEESDDAMRRIDARRAAAARASGGGGVRFRAGGKSARQLEAEAAGFVGVGDNPALQGGGQLNQFGDPNDRTVNLPNAGGSRLWRQPAKRTPEEIKFDMQQTAADAQAGRQQKLQDDAQANAAKQWQAREDARLREVNPLYGVDMKGWGEEKKRKFRDLQTADEKSRQDLTPQEIPEYNRQLQNKVASISAMPDESPETIPLGEQKLAEGETIEFGGNLLQAVRGSTGKLEFKKITERDDTERKSQEAELKLEDARKKAERKSQEAELKLEDARKKADVKMYMDIKKRGKITLDEDGTEVRSEMTSAEIIKEMRDAKEALAAIDKADDPNQPEQENVTTIDDTGAVVDHTKLPVGSYVTFQREDKTVGRAQTMADGNIRELAPGEEEKAQPSQSPAPAGQAPNIYNIEAVAIDPLTKQKYVVRRNENTGKDEWVKM